MMISMFSATKSEKKEKIVKWIRDKVDYSGEKERKPYTFNRDVSYLDCQLPCISQLQPQLRDTYIRSVIDEDMKSDLEDANVIGWTPRALKLLPVSVPRDGNCLLHAASVAVWSVEDIRGTLRDLMLMTVQTNNNFKKRWYCQMMRDLQPLESCSPEIINQEWEDVIRSISNLGSNSLSLAVPNRFLESVHIYILSNILRRPIIVITDSQARSLAGHGLQENYISGLYLPLEWPPIDCCKTPIVLGYSYSHFCPLLSETQSWHLPGKEDPALFPLVNKDLEFLPVRYVTMDEDPIAWDLVQQYLMVKEVNVQGNGGTTKVPFARVVLRPLEMERNALFDHLECIKVRLREATFLEVSKGQLYSTLRASQKINHPFYDIEVSSQTVPINAMKGKSEALKTREATPTAVHIHNVRKENDSTPEKCITEDCTKQGSPQLDNFCHDCFRILSTAQLHIFSISPNEVNIVPSQMKTPASMEDENFTLHSVENRLNNGEGHALTPTAPPASLEPQSRNQLASMMTERCINHCGYRCSRQTYPYCHDCFPQELQRKNMSEQSASPPTAPLENAEMAAVKPKTDAKSTLEGAVGLNDPLIFDLRPIVLNPSLPSSEVLSPSSNFNSMDQKLNMKSESLENSMFILLNETSQYSSIQMSENMLDQHCKNFKMCNGHKMLDHDICYSCAENEKMAENSENNTTTLQEQSTLGKADVAKEGSMTSLVEMATEPNVESCTEAFAETNMKNVVGDIEVSEEPSCSVRCASPYCQSFVFPPDKLCNKCKEILRKGYEQAAVRGEKGEHVATELTLMSTTIKDQLEKEKRFREVSSETPSMPQHAVSITAEGKPLKDRLFPETVHGFPQGVNLQGSYKHVPRGKPCIVPSCPNFGDPDMENKCSSCFFANKQSVNPQRTVSGSTKDITISPKHRTSFAQQSYNNIPTQTKHSSGTRAVPNRFYEACALSDRRVPAHPSRLESFQESRTELSHLPGQSLSNLESKSVLVTSLTGHSGGESLHHLPASSSYSFNHAVDKNLEKTFQGIEKNWKNTARKCLSVTCKNYGNKEKEGYCNACFKVIRRQRIIEMELKRGEDVPDRDDLDKNICAESNFLISR